MWKFSKVKKIKYQKTISVILAVLLIFQVVLPIQVLAATKSWDFSTSSDYTFDNTKVEFSSGQTQLKATSSPAWYNTSWTRRKPITITGSTAGAQTNYQLKITIPYTTGMQADFDDIRFTSSDGTTLIDHWLESKTDSSTADFWVEIPSIPASPDTTTVYLYYGNSNVSSTSDGTATFTFFDDFSSNTINASSWPDNAGNPIFTPGLGSVVKKDGVYYFFYDAAYNGTGINVATSSDGVNFTPDSVHNPVLSSGGVGTWDHNHIGIPYVFKDGNTYYMTYRGDNGSPYVRAGGLAYSTDLITWTKNTNNPYLTDTEAWVPKTGSTLGVEAWGVIKVGNTYYQFYSGFGGTTRRVGFMTTTDTPDNWSASSFTKNPTNPIFDDLYRCMEVFKYGNYYYGIVVYNAAQLILYRDTQPTFLPADRELIGVIKNGSEITSWTDGFPDVAHVLVDDVSRSTFPDSDFKTYYAGEVDGTHWKQGLMQMSFDDLPAALAPASLLWSTITGAVTVSGGNLVLTGTTGTRGLIEQDSSTAPAFQYGRILSRFKTNNSTPGSLYPIGVRKSGDDTERIALYGDSSTANKLNLYTAAGGTNTTTAINSADLQNWHTWEITWKSGEVKAYQDGTLKATNTTNITSQSAVTFLREGPTVGGDADVDWIAAGKWVSPEPTYSIDSESKVYAIDNPSIYSSTSQLFTSVSGFTETATKNGGEIKYQISNDNGTTWYWYNSGWTTTSTGYTEANTADDINSNIATFPVGSGQFLFKAYLNSDGTQLVQINNVDVTYANTHTLTYTAGAHGSITGTSPQAVDDGADGSAVTAVANTGYHFVNWSDDSTDNPRTDTGVTDNISVTANFEATAPTTYIVTASAGSHGSISPSGATTVNSGDNQSFTITADSGYHISDVVVDGPSVGTVSSYTFNNVTAAHTISATFAVTSSGGSSGSPAIWTLPNVPSIGFKMSINGGVPTTSNRNVFLGFNAGTDIKKMSISMTGDFTDASQENYTASKQWDLCSKFGGAIKNPTCPDGTYKVYAQFYTAYGRTSASAVASSTITLKSGTTSVENLQQTTNLPFTNPFTKYLQYRQTNADIKRLQIFLNADPDTKIADTGAGSPGKETNYFGLLTYKAVIKFQEKYAKDILDPWGFKKGTGYVGKTTLAKINELMKNK